jgi:hypothetical protein
MTMLKLGTLALMTGCFFWLFVFGPLYSHLIAQGLALAGVLAWSHLRFGRRETLSLLKFCLPFVAFLLAFGLIFHFTRLLGRQDWLADTFVKCLVFPSSLTFLKIMLSYVTYLDILRLPLSMNRRIDVITVKSAFQKGSRALKRFSWYLSTYSGLRSRHRIRYAMTKYACLIIALYLYLYQEIENSNRLLKNRYRHLG